MQLLLSKVDNSAELEYKLNDNVRKNWDDLKDIKNEMGRCGRTLLMSPLEADFYEQVMPDNSVDFGESSTA